MKKLGGAREMLHKSRWILLVLGFLLLNDIVIFQWKNHQREAPEIQVSFEVPENGELAAGSRDVLRWHFSADMVATNCIGKWAATGPVIFSPEVPGEFCWSAPDELSFRPLGHWRTCLAYSAVFLDGLNSLDGRPLDGARTVAFQSPPLKWLGVRQSNVTANGNHQLDFEFSEPVSLPVLLKYLEVRNPQGEKVSVRQSGDSGAHKILHVALDSVGEGTFSVSLRKGLPTTAGPLGLEEDLEQTVELSRTLQVLWVAGEARPFQSGVVEMGFNAPVDPQEAKAHLHIEPEMNFTVEYSRVRDGRQYLSVLGNFEPGKSYTLLFSKGMESEPGLELTKDEVRSVYFSVRRAEVNFTGVGTYLSPQGNLSVPYQAVNCGKCNVTIRRAYSNNLVYMLSRESGRYGRSRHWMRGLDQSMAGFELPIAADVNEVVKDELELRPWLEGKTGAFQLSIDGERGGSSTCNIVVSDLGISARSSEKDMLVWVNSIHDLKPVGGAEIQVFSAENQVLLSGETDADGLLRLDPEEMKTEGTPFLVVAEKGDDLTYLQMEDSSVCQPGAVGQRAYLEDGYEAFLFTDRGIYRPGETVHCKSIVRGRNVEPPESLPVELVLVRPDGKPDRTLSGLLSNWGTVEFDLPLADYVATGRYRLQVRIPEADAPMEEISISVEEFVPPQIRTTLQLPKGRSSAGQELEFTVSGQHLFGRPAAGMNAQARVEYRSCAFAPEAWSGYVFGDPRRNFSDVVMTLDRQMLDQNGVARFASKTSTQWRPPAAVQAVVSGSVQEIGGRTVTDFGGCAVDVYPEYIGFERPDGPLWVGEMHSFDLAVVQPDGATAERDIALKVHLEKLSWVTVMQKSGDHYYYTSERQSTTVGEQEITATNGVAEVAFEPKYAGSYRLVVSETHGVVVSSMEFETRVPGQRWSTRSLAAPDVVELELDRDTYQVGDTARLQINAPFAGRALLTVESDEILLTRVLDLTNNVAEVELSVESAYRPNVYCAVSVLRAALPEEIWGQHRASGRVALMVEQPEQKLSVELEVPDEMRPGTRLEIPVQVSQSDGTGCASEVVLAAVDEGICMLSGFKTPDPYAYFFGPRRPTISLHDLYNRLMPETLKKSDGAASAPGGGMWAAIGKRVNPIKARRFKPVALWSSSVETDADGKAHVVFEVPEFTGQLRIMAVAVAKTRFGSAEQSVIVKRPLVVQSSLPRFLAPEDAFSMPVRVYNETGTNGIVDVSVSGEGALNFGALHQSVELADGAATNLMFKLQAGSIPGKAVCHLTAVMGDEQYAEDVELAVRPAAPRTQVCGSGKVAAGMDETIEVSGNWLEGTGETALWVSGLPTVKLKGSLDYLVDYPYGCLEQTTSSAFPLLYLAAWAEQMRPGWLGAGGTREFVNEGIYRILSMQKSSGGFSLWPNHGVYEWGSIYAIHFLVEAGRAGYDVPKTRLSEALDYLEEKVRRATFDRSEAYYDTSYGCFVLALGGRPQHGTVARLCEIWDDLKYDTRIHLVAARLAAGQRRNAVELLDRLGNPMETPIPRQTGGSLRSSVRGNAFLLSVLLDVEPESDRVPELARRLEAGQSNGRWGHTQDNAVALMALGKYTQRMAEKQLPVSGAIRWNDGSKSMAFENRDQLRVALAELQGERVQIENRGAGDLYYYWKSEGVPEDSATIELDHRIKIRRTLLDAQGEPVDPKALRQGELYVMRWTVSTDERVENLVIEDPLPAGLEVENGALNTSQSLAWIQRPSQISMLHVDVRDDRVIAFPCAIDGEPKNYYFGVRAVTEGEFVWPSVSAACMYDASIESVSGKGRIQVRAE